MALPVHRLLAVARAVRENAHAPYSGFKVGAALFDEKGAIHAGCNVENAAYPEGACAETNALGALVSSGAKQCLAVVICAGDDTVITPCGGCRQRLAELGTANTQVFCFSADGRLQAETILGDLLPMGFSASDFQGGES